MALKTFNGDFVVACGFVLCTGVCPFYVHRNILQIYDRHRLFGNLHFLFTALLNQAHTTPSNPSIHPSMNQSMNESINQSISESINQSINQSSNHSIKKMLQTISQSQTQTDRQIDRMIIVF